MQSHAETVVITGATGDIGRALAFEFAARGAALALSDLVDEAAAATLIEGCEQRGSKAFYRRADVAQAEEMDALMGWAEAKLGGLSVCIGNAGIVERGLLSGLSPERWKRQIDVNLTGCFFAGQAAARVMRERGGGQILFIGSWVQEIPRAGIGAYCVSKSGIEMLARCMALEMARDGIRVNVVAPGFVDAGLTAQNLRLHPELRAGMEAEVPLGRLISAEELARAAMLLCSGDAAYITGTTLLVDGGCSLRLR